MHSQGAFLPKPKGIERQNVWYNDSTPVSKYDIPSGSLSIDPSNVINLIERNTVILLIKKKDGRGDYTSRARAVGIQSSLFVTVGHLFDNCDDNFQVEIIGSPHGGSNSNMTLTLNLSTCVSRKNDIAIVNLLGYNQCRNIRSLIPESDKFKYSGTGLCITRLRDCGTTFNFPLHNVYYGTHVLDTNMVIYGPKYRSNNAFLRGSCGSPILIKLSHKNRYVFSSIHCAGIDNTHPPGTIEFSSSKSCEGLSHAINLNLLDDLIQNLDSFQPLSYLESELGSNDKKIVLHSLHYKSPVNYIEKGTCMVFGSLSCPRAHMKTTVKPHALAEYFKCRGYVSEHYPPDLTSWKPWRLALLDTLNPVTNVKLDILKDVTESFINDIFSSVPMSDIKHMVHPVPMSVAINGFPSVAYIDSIPRSTSAGHPWRCPKTKLTKPCIPDEIFQDPIDFNSEIYDRVHSIEQRYINGFRAMPIFTASLKDEPVSLSKHKSGKVRIFSGAPLDFSLVVRKSLLGCIRLIQRNKLSFESAPGLIAQSREWHDLHEWLSEYGSNRIVCGDYKAFDKTMPPSIIFASFKILFEICLRSGNYSDDDCMIIRGISTDIAYALTNYNGDLLMFFGSNPSGNPLTVIINCLANCLYMRYVYHILNPKGTGATDFRSNVRLITYGDDNTLSSKVDWFNHTTISECLKKELGIVYTMADKEADSIPFISLNEASFLKRSWRYDSDIGHYMAKLDHQSIVKMLTIWNESKSISHDEQALATIESAYREYFYYGKHIFEEKRILLLKAITDNNLHYLLKKRELPTWEELVEQYWLNSSADDNQEFSSLLYNIKPNVHPPHF